MTLFLALTFSTVLYAEVFQGEVKSVDAGGNQIRVIKKDSGTAKTGSQEFQVQTSRKTRLKNFSSLEELRPGDEINVNAKRRGKENSWQAKSLSMAKVKINQ